MVQAQGLFRLAEIEIHPQSVLETFFYADSAQCS